MKLLPYTSVNIQYFIHVPFPFRSGKTVFIVMVLWSCSGGIAGVKDFT